MAFETMLQSTRHETPESVSIKLPWDKNSFRGFVGALAFLLLFLVFSQVYKVPPPVHIIPKHNRIPTDLLIFGPGDGTGMRKGNLTEEGVSNKGPESANDLEDAKQAAKSNKHGKASDEFQLADNYIPKDRLEGEKGKGIAGRDTRQIGKKDGVEDGSGLGGSGSGKGAGQGFGDIDWGGGGNRIVLKKVIPKYPRGVNTSARLLLQFTVLPDGTVGRVIPLQKADPLLEKAAMEALKKWRFNPLKDNETIMIGVIPLTFSLT